MAADARALAADRAAPAEAGRREVVVDRGRVALWDLTGGLIIFFAGSFLHFLFELSGFNTVAAPFASVNESTWEHLKLFFWPAVLFAVVQHAYTRDVVHNFWAAKGASVVITPLAVAIGFYAYIGVVIPIYGKGTLFGTLVTAAIGVTLGQVASYRLLTGRQRGRLAHVLGVAAVLGVGTAMVVFTFFPPHVFLFENFFGYTYDGQFGILADYTPFLVFK